MSSHRPGSTDVAPRCPQAYTNGGRTLESAEWLLSGLAQVPVDKEHCACAEEGTPGASLVDSAMLEVRGQCTFAFAGSFSPSTLYFSIWQWGIEDQYRCRPDER